MVYNSVPIYSNHLNSGLVQYSNGRFVCTVVKWSSIQMVVWKPDWKKPVCGQKCPVCEWSGKSHYFTIWIPSPKVSGIQMNTVFSVRYSDGYCIFFKAIDWIHKHLHPSLDGPTQLCPTFWDESRSQRSQRLRQLNPFQRRGKSSRFRLGWSQDLHLGLGEKEESLLFQIGSHSKRFSIKVSTIFRYCVCNVAVSKMIIK